MNPLKTIDKFLNGITMYRLMVYGLGLLLVGAVASSLLGHLPISATAIIVSSVVILIVGLIADKLLPVIFGAPSNKYSSLITSLILCCILPPSTSAHHLALLALGVLIAIAGKYIVSIHYKHLFNPAALAALILGLTGLLPAIWWIGSPSMLPLTVILGLLVLRKMRRFSLFLSFAFAALVVTIAVGLHHDLGVSYLLQTAIKSSPLIFLGSIMLTEPSTTPPRLPEQLIYGLLVGAIFMSQLRIGRVTTTPEIALIIGNIYTYIVSPKYRMRLQFNNKQQLAPQIYDFSFTSNKSLMFEPGQYLEWTLPMSHSDRRGNRRLFSIASAPGDNELHLLTKFSEPGSSFKKGLLALSSGDLMMAGQLAGDFILPKNLDQKIVLIAGGIGISPYVSMVKDMIKTGARRDILLFYLVAVPADFCYQDLWQQAKNLGVRVVPIVSGDNPVAWQGRTGYLTDKILTEEAPDYLDRHYYISGPPGLVDNYLRLLKNMKINRTQIVTDHFSGY